MTQKTYMLQELKNIGHWGLAIVAAWWYGFPARKLNMVGVTGTDGKTTTTSLIYHILRTAKIKAAMITSVGAYIGDQRYDIGFHVTTPSPFGVQKYLKRALDEGNTHVVLEVTSHALDQHRVWGIPFVIGVLTNITHEHLDYHKDYPTYVATKAKLFAVSEKAVVNVEDHSYATIQAYLHGKDVTTYGITTKSAEITPKTFPFQTTMIGQCNVYNALAAVGACVQLGVSVDVIRKGILSFRLPPGRQEMVYEKDFKVMIDFAHTPNSFTQILPDIKRLIGKGRLIHVFGSAGLRDQTKRPLMGKASSESADVIIITAEDPRTESVQDISAAINSGIPRSFAREDYRLPAIRRDRRVVYLIPDRQEAINFAIAIAKKGDMVVATGKAHETSMNYGNGEEPWNEFEAVAKALQKRA